MDVSRTILMNASSVCDKALETIREFDAFKHRLYGIIGTRAIAWDRLSRVPLSISNSGI